MTVGAAASVRRAHRFVSPEPHRAGEPMFPPGAATGRTGDLGKGVDQFRPRIDALLRDLVDQALKEAYAALGEVE
jgi:hypothetical protein